MYAYELVWPSVDIPRPQLQRLPVRGLFIFMATESHYLVIIATKQAAAPLPFWTPPTPLFLLLRSDPSLHSLTPHPILSGFIQCRLYVCHSIHYPFSRPLCLFTAGHKANQNGFNWSTADLMWKKIVTWSSCDVLFPNNLEASKHTICMPDTQVKDKIFQHLLHLHHYRIKINKGRC